MQDIMMEVCLVELESCLVFQEIIIEELNLMVIVYEMEMVKLCDYLCLFMEKLKVSQLLNIVFQVEEMLLLYY